ncbi:hypothetical protein LCGC14_0428310 [marine sediment metagenome]|uniref:Uncharacterized protein n=1 Tax=marine sediment metagenome TaxID=412755 RepID=A0A0F9VAT6_9ZZZZ
MEMNCRCITIPKGNRFDLYRHGTLILQGGCLDGCVDEGDPDMELRVDTPLGRVVYRNTGLIKHGRHIFKFVPPGNPY